MRLVVAEKRSVASDVFEFTLVASDDGVLPPWNPGAHIELRLDNGMIRPYSLTGAVNDRYRWRIAVLREPEGRGGSRFICDELQPGDSAAVRGPINNFRLLPAQRYRFIAGGIGITPILPMVRTRVGLSASWTFDYIGRSTESMAYVTDLPEGTTIHATRSGGRPSLESLVSDLREDELVYACGSQSLMLALEDVLGPRRAALRTEWFAPRPMVRAADAYDSFEVALARSGVDLMVHDGESIVEAASAAGIYIPTSCGEGTCGSCETFLVEGVADHRDSVLDSEERAAGDLIIPCVAGARSPRLVLDA